MEYKASRSGRCWYCCGETLRDGDPLEHVVPAAIQGTLTTDRVCKGCNHLASKLDQQFLQDSWIAISRLEHNVPDRYGNPPPHLKHKARLKSDGTPIRINMRSGQWQAEPVVQVHENEDGSFTVSAATQEEAERKIEELRAKAGADATVTIREVRSQTIPPQEVDVQMRVAPLLTLRMTAKMAHGALSLVWNDEWLDTPQAKELQGWLRHANPRDSQGELLGMVPAQPTLVFKALCPPPEHLLLLQAGAARDETYFTAMLVGEHVTNLAIANGGQPPPQTAWLIDARGSRPQRLSIEQLALVAGQRTGRIPKLDELEQEIKE